MASTRNYLDYLNNQIDIAPVNSEEEIQAAQSIARVFELHGLEPTIQDFSIRSGADIVHGILLIVEFAGVVLAGTQFKPLPTIGILLALASAGLLIAAYCGYDVLASLGPQAHSQNVVAFHKASGPLVSKGNRPIIIAAHYDTPRADLFYKPSMARFGVMVKRGSVVLVPLTAALTFVNLFSKIPVMTLRVIWAIDILACLPLFLWGISLVSYRFMGCTQGANSNKSSVACMLSICDQVCLQKAMSDRQQAHEESEADTDIENATVQEEVYEEVIGVRHGEEVLKSLGILPDTCKITYVAPALIRTQPVESAEDKTNSTRPLDARELFEAQTPLSTEEIVIDKRATEEGLATSKPTQEAVETGSVQSPQTEEDADSTSRVLRRAQPAGRRAALFNLADPSVDSVDPLDATGDYQIGELSPTPLVNPYQEKASQPVENVRIDTDQEQLRTITPDDLEASQKKKRGLFGRRKKRQEQSMSDWLGVEESYDARENGRSIGSWENFENGSQGRWKGGAALNGRFRVFDGKDQTTLDKEVGSTDRINMEEPLRNTGNNQASEDMYESTVLAGNDGIVSAGAAGANGSSDGVFNEALAGNTPSLDDLRDAALSMGSDELICHDIWFVALGGSELGNAGMKAFLEKYRKNCRGSFLFNLDCIGSGQLTVLTQEGFDNYRKADKRLLSLIRTTAQDIHLDIDEKTMRWGDTDATPAMRTSMRSATIVGIDKNGLPAYKRSMEDTEEIVDAQQVDNVRALIMEAIRRS